MERSVLVEVGGEYEKVMGMGILKIHCQTINKENMRPKMNGNKQIKRQGN